MPHHTARFLGYDELRSLLYKEHLRAADPNDNSSALEAALHKVTEIRAELDMPQWLGLAVELPLLDDGRTSVWVRVTDLLSIEEQLRLPDTT